VLKRWCSRFIRGRFWLVALAYRHLILESSDFHCATSSALELGPAHGQYHVGTTAARPVRTPNHCCAPLLFPYRCPSSWCERSMFQNVMERSCGLCVHVYALARMPERRRHALRQLTLRRKLPQFCEGQGGIGTGICRFLRCLCRHGLEPRRQSFAGRLSDGDQDARRRRGPDERPDGLGLQPMRR